MRTRPHTRYVRYRTPNKRLNKIGIQWQKKYMAHKTHTHWQPKHICIYTNRPTQLCRRYAREFCRFRDKQRTGRLHRYVCEHVVGSKLQYRDKNGNWTAHACCYPVPDMLLMANVAATIRNIYSKILNASNDVERRPEILMCSIYRVNANDGIRVAL